MPASAAARIGTELACYRLDALIGRGGMGVVYRAHDLALDRDVALKLLAPQLANDGSFRERFLTESRVSASLEHPNVVPIHDAGEIDGQLYIAMRLVEGSDLKAVLRQGPLEPTRAVRILEQIAAALDAAHARGLVHRDVKPSNVLLDEREHAYLADFGLSRYLGDAALPLGPAKSLGTADYVAPEQIRGEEVDGRADVYALGCLLYECLAGVAPFRRGTDAATLFAQLEEAPSVLPGLEEVLPRALAKEPAERYATCGELIEDARQALGIAEPKRGRWPFAVAAVGLALIGAALLAFFLASGGGNASALPPAVEANTLVRIDPATNKLAAVVHVGRGPSAIAVGGRSVWVYSYDGSSVSEVDGATGALRHTTELVSAPRHRPNAFEGPVLAADSAGAWLVGVDRRGRSHLTRVFSGKRPKLDYRLEGEPLAVAVGFGAVWVITRGARDNHLLRIDPATGKIAKRKRFPGSSPIDGLAAGLGSVWVGASSTATLYRIDPHSTRTTGLLDLGQHAGRPVVMVADARGPAGIGQVWADLSDQGGFIVVVEQRKPLSFVRWPGCFCLDPERGSFTGGHGSIWTFDTPSGTVRRGRGGDGNFVARITVTNPTHNHGLCLTSIASGPGAVWVTVAGDPSDPATPNAGETCSISS